MEEQQKVESGEQEEEKKLTAKEKIELERQEEAKLRQKFPMAGRPGLPGKPAGGKIFAAGEVGNAEVLWCFLGIKPNLQGLGVSQAFCRNVWPRTLNILTVGIIR